MTDAQQREREARDGVRLAVEAWFGMTGTSDDIHAAMDAYRAAVRAARDEEIVAKVREKSRVRFVEATPEAVARLTFANDLIATIRGLAAPTTEER